MIAIKEGKTLYEKLAIAQSKFKPAIKSAENPFYKSSYADLSGVWEACKDALHEQGLFVSQPLAYEEGRNFVLTYVYDDTGASISSKLEVTSASNMQALGSGITYARRYSLASILGIVTEDDDGNASVEDKNKTREQAKDTSKPTEPVTETVKFITMAQQGKISALYSEKGLDRDAMKLVLKSRYGVESHKAMTLGEASDYIGYLMGLSAKDDVSMLDGNLPGDFK